MKISTNTKLCISIASVPGNFGMNFHNSSYKYLNLDWIYIARQVKNITELEGVIGGIRALNIKGCSVSMPHKEAVIQFLDDIDGPAKEIGAINTIKNFKNKLIGFNTDFYGAKISLKEVSIKGKNILLIGAGGAAKAVGFAVKKQGGNLTISSRDYNKAKKLSEILNAKVIKFEEITNSSGNLLINATPVGMKNANEIIVEKDVIKNYNVIMDLVINHKKTKLIRLATELGKEIIPGKVMCVYQAAQQFKIYTGLDAPEKVINKTLEDIEK